MANLFNLKTAVDRREAAGFCDFARCGCIRLARAAGGARSARPLRNAWKARDRIARHFCRRVNCSALLAKPRRKTAAAASALAAGFALACELVTRIVVCRACRVRVAMADRNKGRLVIASRWRLGSTRRTIVEQRQQPRRQTAAREVVRGEAAPAPLVLHFVENILSVAPIAIQLTERLRIFVQRGDQNRVFVDFRRRADLGEGKLRRAGVADLRKPQSALHTPAQHDHEPAPAPARQAHRALLRLEAFTGANPFARASELLDHALDVGGQAQLEQEGKSARLGIAHDPLVAETAIAAQQGQPQVARQAIEQRPQARRAMFGRELVAGTDVDIENKTPVRAINFASAAPSKIRGRAEFGLYLRVSAAAIPSSTSRRRVRPILFMLVSNAAEIALSLQPSPASDTSAFRRMRAFVSDCAGCLPAQIIVSSCSRSSALSFTTYFLTEISLPATNHLHRRIAATEIQRNSTDSMTLATTSIQLHNGRRPGRSVSATERETMSRTQRGPSLTACA